MFFSIQLTVKSRTVIGKKPYTEIYDAAAIYVRYLHTFKGLKLKIENPYTFIACGGNNSFGQIRPKMLFLNLNLKRPNGVDKSRAKNRPLGPLLHSLIGIYKT